MTHEKNTGFTLIETLISLAVFAIVALAVTSLLVSNTRMVAENAQTSRAIALAQDSMEILREVNFASLVNGTRPAVSIGGATYQVSWAVQADTPIVGTATVAVTVSWQHKGSPRSYVLKSLFANPLQ